MTMTRPWHRYSYATFLFSFIWTADLASCFISLSPSPGGQIAPAFLCTPSSSIAVAASTAKSIIFSSDGDDRDDDNIIITTEDTTRRLLILRPISAAIIAFGSSSSITLSSSFVPAAFAAAITQEQKDKENLVRGYNRLQYLLDNWEDETTICKIGQETTFGDKCERTPTKVMEYLGFKSTNDPLFKADATMMRLKEAIPSRNAQREAEYYDAMDLFVQNAEEANSMAFVSSWGEANPGGGKDRVRLFIERSKNNVIASRDGLGIVLDILDLKP